MKVFIVMDDKDKKIEELEEKNDILESRLIDLTFTLNYNKETELMEFLRELYSSLNDVDDKLSKEDLLKNLKLYIENFVKDNKLML